MSHEEEERAAFHATVACLLNCTPGNFDHGEGEPCVILTYGRGSGVEHLAFPLADTRKIVLRMLVALATYEDGVAQKLLDDHFDWDEDGHYIWPNAT